MRIYTLRNDFHNSEVRVRCEGLSHIHGECEIKLSERQSSRARRELCGITGCTCATQDCGIRGRQTTDDGKRLIVLEPWM
jgi:hypothetical protein